MSNEKLRQEITEEDIQKEMQWLRSYNMDNDKECREAAIEIQTSLKTAKSQVPCKNETPLYDREKIAELCHEQWSGWMKYLFNKSPNTENGEAIIPKWAVDRWTRQINTPYESLSESEKESDRNEADRFIRLILGVELEPQTNKGKQDGKNNN